MTDENEDSGSYYTDDVKPKKGGSIKKGIGIGVLVTLVFELFVSFALDAQTNLVHRYIAYMMGILALFVAALYAKSIWKMFFLGTPVIVGTSFILPLASPDNFSGLMSPFINLLPTINAIADSLEATGQDMSTYENILNLVNNPLYGILLDFILAITIGTIAALGLVGLVKIFSNKRGILTIISFIFSLFFFIMGVIILPYILVVSTGITQFGLALGAGGLNLRAGFEEINGNGDMDKANAFFTEAEKWFGDADSMLQGLEDMQLFSLLGRTVPDYKVLVDNFLILIDSAVDMAKSVGPLFIGITALQNGMEKSMSVLTGALASTNLQMSALSTADDAIFEEGLVDVKAGFGNISKAIPDIQKALLRFEKVNRVETLETAKAQNVDVEEQLDLIEGAINLMNSALDIMNILITPATDTNPSDDFTVEEPLIHLLRGAVALSDASSSVGSTSSFEGTGPAFEKIVSHLEIVVFTIEDQVFDNFANTEVNNVTELTEIKEQLSGMFDFIHDTGSISIAMGEFGLIASPTLLQMNETMSIFQGRSFTVIDDLEYEAAELNFTKSDGIINGSTQMRDEGKAVDTLVAQMETKSINDEYGLMSAGATDFVSVFKEFDMAVNGLNFFHLSHGFLNVILTARELTVVDGLVDNIQTGAEFLTSVVNYTLDAGAINIVITNIQGNSSDIGTSLNKINITLSDAAGNFSIVGTTMPQMAGTATAIDNIQTNVAAIDDAIGIIETETSVLPTTPTEFTNKTNEIEAQLIIIEDQLILVDGNINQVEIVG